MNPNKEYFDLNRGHSWPPWDSIWVCIHSNWNLLTSKQPLWLHLGSHCIYALCKMVIWQLIS